MLRQNSTHNEESLSLSEHQSASASDGSVNINEKELDFESEKILGCHIIQTHEDVSSSTLITPTVKAPLCVDYRTFSPCRIGDKMRRDGVGGQYRRILYDVADIDEIQASKDPNYNRAYAWSIARMKQEEEELYVQHLPSNKGGASSPPVSGDISYPWFCSNQSLFPSHQTEVNAVMHITLVDWLVKVCIERGLPSCTLCLAIHLMDEFIRRQPDIPTHRFQLLGCACLILAAKLEQIKFPGIDELVHISNYCFLRGDLIEMERTVLNALDYNVSIPTRMYFLNRFILAAQVDDCPVTSSSGREESGDMSSGSNTSLAQIDLHQHQAANERNFKEACFAYYLLDLTLQNYAFNQYPMSVVAAAIVHYVKQYYRSVNELVWTPTLVFYTGYEERHLVPVLFAIHAIHSSAYCTGFTATVKKYYCQQYCYCCSEIAVSKERIRFDTLAAKNILNDFEERIAQEDVCEHDTVNGDDDSTEECHEKYDEQSDNTKCDVDADGDRVNLTPTSFLNDKAEVGEATDKEKNILKVGEGNVNNSQHQRDTGIRKGPEHSGDIQQVVTHESTGGGGGGGLRLEFSGDDESVRKKQRCHSDHDSD